MTDRLKFDEVVNRHGMKRYEVAAALGMSPQSLTNKLGNATQFTAREMANFKNLFPDVTDSEFSAIFFAEALA